MHLHAAHNLVVFTICSRQVSASQPEKSAHHQVGAKDERPNLRKGSKEKASADYNQNGNLAGANSENTSHTILGNSLEFKNGSTVEYEVGLVKQDNGGVAYHLTFAKKAAPAKLAETDIPGEGGQVDGIGGEGEGHGDQAQGEGEGDQVDEGVTRDTEYWYGAPPLRESGPKIETGNIFASGERFKPQRITYEKAGKGNQDAAIKRNHDAAVIGNQDTAVKGNHDAAVIGNQDAAVKGNHDAAVSVKGNHDAAVIGNQDAAVIGNQDAAVKGNHLLLPTSIANCTDNSTVLCNQVTPIDTAKPPISAKRHKSTNPAQVKGNHVAAVKGDQKDHKLKINRQHKV